VTELENYLTSKTADVSGTHLMPSGAPVYTDPNRNPAKTIKKVAESSDLVQSLELGEGQSGEQVQKLPQAAPIPLRVDTTGKNAPTLPSTKTAERYALPAFSRYPLDSYAHVKQASVYFDEYSGQMAPELRHEYCQNLVKRADELGIKVSSAARKYGSSSYAPLSEIESALSMRTGVLKEAAFQGGLDYLRQNRALMKPLDFAVALSEFDKIAGIAEHYDRDIYDPYFSTFGEKRASEDTAILVGNDYISHEELKRFAQTAADKLNEGFGEDFVKEFRKDPVGVTKSLPVDQKKMVIRLASSTLTDPTTT
jgi:hypothetical protein